jgi:hypothetical protein
MHENPQILSYVLRCIAEQKSEEQSAERLDGEITLVETWIDALKQTDFVSINYFDELVIPDGKNYLKYLSQIISQLYEICYILIPIIRWQRVSRITTH